MALFDRERAQLEAAFDWLESRSDKASAQILLSLGNAVVYTSELRFHPRQQIRWLEAQVKAAQLAGDRQAESNAFGNLGLAYAALGEARKAIEFYEQQLAICREIGDQRGEGNALWNSALRLWELNDRAEAIARAEAAARIFEAIEDPHAPKVRALLAKWRKAGTG